MSDDALPLFAYGTLTSPRVREQVLGRRPDLEAVRARLAGYERTSVPGFDHPFAVPADGGTVEGVLIFGLTTDDYTTLDEYEDVAARLYERVEAQVELLGCGTPGAVRAWLYGKGVGGQGPGVGEPG
jgi:gamma-glutamylcyclotransferase (GGCT)/AIG2-like uncharacterized protein YtfP